MISDSCKGKGIDSEQGAQSEIFIWSRVENLESSSKMLSSISIVNGVDGRLEDLELSRNHLV